MKIVNERPPIYDGATAVFGTIPDSVVFAYGDTIYNPSGQSLSEDIIAHEEIHELQQGENPAAWWEAYLSDAEFRLDQELAAYRHQYRFMLKNEPDREKRNLALLHFAKSLSGPIYGNLMSRDEAMSQIMSEKLI